MITVAPFDKDLELNIISLMVLHPETIPIIAKRITAKSFYLDDHQRIFKAILNDYHLSGTDMDFLSVTQKYRTLYPETKESGTVVLADAMILSPFPSKSEWYINQMLDYHGRRKMLRMGHYMQKHADDMSIDTNELITKIQGGMDMVKNSVKLDVNLSDDIEDMSLNIGNKDLTIPFGIPVLDRKVSGYMRNDITTLGGRTSHGKTTFTIDTVKKQLDRGYKISLVTNEVTKRLYLQKLACNIAKIEYQKVIKFGNITDEEREEFGNAKEYMLDKYVGLLSIYEFVDNISAITSIIADDKSDIFYLDWLQRIPLVPGEHDDKRVIKIVYGELAKAVVKTNSACAVVSQLSTRKSQVGQGTPRRPQLFDFDDSSFIEKASCDCHLIYWYYADTLEKDMMSVVELMNAKNRFGEPNVSLLGFDPKIGRYMDSSLITPETKKRYIERSGLR